MFQASMPKNFWGESILMATHIINILSSMQLKWKSPFELLYGYKPSFENLKVFGSLCYVTDHKSSNDKFNP